MPWFYLPDCWYYLPKWQFRFIFLMQPILTAFPVCVRFLDFTTTVMFIRWKVRNNKLIIMQVSPAICYFLSCRSKFSLHYHVLRNPWSMFSRCYLAQTVALLTFRKVSCFTLGRSIEYAKCLLGFTQALQAYTVCPESKCTDFLFKYLLELPEITSDLLQSMTLGKIHSGSNVSSTDRSSTGSHFP
jgi:hypothetical protein